MNWLFTSDSGAASRLFGDSTHPPGRGHFFGMSSFLLRLGRLLLLSTSYALIPHVMHRLPLQRQTPLPPRRHRRRHRQIIPLRHNPVGPCVLLHPISFFLPWPTAPSTVLRISCHSPAPCCRSLHPKPQRQAATGAPLRLPATAALGNRRRAVATGLPFSALRQRPFYLCRAVPCAAPAAMRFDYNVVYRCDCVGLLTVYWPPPKPEKPIMAAMSSLTSSATTSSPPSSPPPLPTAAFFAAVSPVGRVGERASEPQREGDAAAGLGQGGVGHTAEGRLAPLHLALLAFLGLVRGK